MRNRVQQHCGWRGWGVLAMWLLCSPAVMATPQHALTLGAPPKYPKGFAHYAYADPQAKKGGTLVLSGLGSFDTLNPFGLKGRPAEMLAGFVFETLTDASWDEPFAKYGLLAQAMDVAADHLSVTFHLNPQAAFSDGHPLTAEDVVFSYAVLRGEGASPMFRFYLQDIAHVEALDAHTVKMTFKNTNPELPLIAGDVPVLPRHVYEGKNFQEAFTRLAVGSGPYMVETFDFGKTITYRRNPAYWGQALSVNVGRHNFERVVVKYYKDDTVRLEGLKAGEYDFHFVNNSKQWAQDVTGDKWDKRWLLRQNLPHQNTAGMQGFVMNVRRPLFQNRQVRMALALALDFPWSNRTLFYGQYTESRSYFNNTELAAKGLPSKDELALLNPLKAKLPEDVFRQPMGPAKEEDIRNRLRQAKQLLEQAGWQIQNGVLVNAKGQPLRFTVTLLEPAFQRIVEPWLANLRRLGIQGDMKVVDDAVYEKLMRTHDFEVTVGSFGQSLSPGNEQRDYWSSASADVEGSRNLIGIKNPAVDALVEKVVRAPNRKALLTAVHALDRVLWHEHYVVPHWYIPTHRVTYWNKLAHPKKLPLYYNPMNYLDFWWMEPGREQALAAAMQAGRPLAGE